MHVSKEIYSSCDSLIFIFSFRFLIDISHMALFRYLRVACKYKLNLNHVVRMNGTTGAGSSSEVKIGTHNGSFHCDETLACSLLKFLPR